MADRRVTATGKDAEGDITSLCKSGELWSPVVKADAIREIENEDNRYYVLVDGDEVDVVVVDDPDGKYLRTDPDQTSSNNLDDLPDC